MRSVALSLVGLAAFACSASAADIYSQPLGGGLKEVPAVVPLFTWAGFYVGVNGGGAWSAHDNHIDVINVTTPPPLLLTFTPPLNQPSRSGPFGGVQVGYNWQFGNFVAGLEGDMQGAGVSGTSRIDTAITAVNGVPIAPIAGTARISSDLDWFGTIRGRLGYSFDSVLLYATGGFAAGGVRDRLLFTSPTVGPITTAFDLRNGETATGFTVGGGLEYAFSPAWSVKLEYQFISLSPERLRNFAAQAVAVPVQTEQTTDFDHDFHTVRLGINYHFHEYCPLPLK